MSTYSMNEIIEFALNIEKRGFTFYNEVLKTKKLDEKSKELITLLRDEEVKHKETFKKLRDDSDIEKMGDLVNWESASSYLSTITDAHIFNSEDSAVNLIKKSHNVMDIVNNAIQFEKDTLLFFHSLKDCINNDSACEAIKTIIEEEKKHLMNLKKYKNSL